MPEKIELKPLPPKEAVDYFRKKGYKIGFDWRDIDQQEHAYSFTVAKAMRTDILQDIRTAMDQAIADGTTFKTFKDQLEPTLQSKGWWGRKEMLDPKTGELKEVQLGSARRLRVIYDTNMRTAYAAGAWERVQRTKKRRPYLRYIAVLDDRTRDRHRAWHDTVLPVDHPFWQQFYPPNGWGCRCSVQQLSERDLERRGLSVTPDDDLPSGDRVWTDKRNGRMIKVPKGIDPGFANNPGISRMKALTPPQIGKPLAVPYAGKPSRVVMPPVRPVGEAALYPEGLSDAAYVERFLKEFDAAPNKPVIFTDRTGAELVISDDLFKTATGRSKLSKDLRARYLGMLAAAIKDPDEIWHVWEEYPKGRMTLRRKYLARFEIEGKKVPAYILFNTNKDGWLGVTAFPPKKENYFEKERNGALVYRRKE